MTLVEHPVAAVNGLYVVPDPASPPIDILLVASLTGGAIMDVEYFRTSGGQGTNVSYEAGVKTKRAIYISDGARMAAPDLVATIESVVTAFGDSKWRLVRHEPAGNTLCASVLALVSGQEKEVHPEWSGCRYALCMQEFLAYVQKLDLATSTAGLCRAD